MKNFDKNVMDFLQHPEKKVLVIKGKWGVGKTYQWNKIVEQNSSRLNFSNYSYVSLFGLNSLKDLQSSVFYNASPLNQKQKKSIVKSNMKKIGNVVKNIPQASKYSAAISIIENSLVNDYLICIDDLERKSETLSMSNLLGYVSNLSNTSDCKIILIFNDDTLLEKDKKDIDKYREKVIDVELEFSPDSERNIDIEFNEHEFRDLICNTFRPEGLNNIRIIKHIKWNIDGLIYFISDSEESVRLDILTTIAILTYIHHEPSINIRANEISRVFDYSKDKSDEDSDLQKRISALGYIYFADHEMEIINYIENGQLDEDIFSGNIKLLNERQKKENISSELTSIWGFYNNNFKGEAEDIITGLTEFLDKRMEFISIRELHPILETLVEISEDFCSDDWFDRYVSVHMVHANSYNIKQLKKLAKSPKIIEELTEKEKDLNEHYSLYPVLNKITKNRGWSPEDEIFLSEHDANEIYEFMVHDEHEDLMQIIREAISIFPQSEGEEPRAKFGNNLNAALMRLGKRSKLDKYRMNHFFGLKVA